jgi:hypothetical protein
MYCNSVIIQKMAADVGAGTAAAIVAKALLAKFPDLDQMLMMCGFTNAMEHAHLMEYEHFASLNAFGDYTNTIIESMAYKNEKRTPAVTCICFGIQHVLYVTSFVLRIVTLPNLLMIISELCLSDLQGSDDWCQLIFPFQLPNRSGQPRNCCRWWVVRVSVLVFVWGNRLVNPLVFDFPIVSCCVLLHHLGLGLGEVWGFTGDRSFFSWLGSFFRRFNVGPVLFAT